MDPRQQPPSRPPQRQPYISDVVPGGTATPGAPGAPPLRPQPRPASGTPAPVAPAPMPPAPAATPAAATAPTPLTPTAAAHQAASAAANPAAPSNTAAGPAEPQPRTGNSFAHPEPEAISPTSVEKKPKKGQGLRDILSIAGVLASALLLAFCLITFVFQSYQVDGPSMQTTLQNRDHLIVWKVPKTIANLTGHVYIPHRGDVIVFNEPSSSGGENKQLIKRVIGLPGERVTVKNEEVTVYNQDHPDGFNPDRTLPYGKVIANTPGNVDVTVPDESVFVMGDNRVNSLDSRASSIGPVNSHQIVGKLVLRVLPLNTVTRF